MRLFFGLGKVVGKFIGYVGIVKVVMEGIWILGRVVEG